MLRWSSLLAVVFLAACASFGGRDLKPGQDGLNEVIRVMGQPAMRWDNPDGSVQLSYPRGPSASVSFMAMIGKDHKLVSIRNVITEESFARIVSGMSKEQVLRILGPSEPSWTIYFAARDELVWDWRCEVNAERAHFLVLFDATKGTVRSTMTMVDRRTSWHF